MARAILVEAKLKVVLIISSSNKGEKMCIMANVDQITVILN